jgi:2-keto-3-deoxy-6-phosphogluconate aldolase
MPLIAILRGQPNRFVEPIVQARADGGFTALKITMNSPGAFAKISAAITHAQGRMSIGAGP